MPKIHPPLELKMKVWYDTKENEWLAKYGQPMPKRTDGRYCCGVCIEHALDDDFNGYISEEELRIVHAKHRERKKKRWLRSMMNPNMK